MTPKTENTVHSEWVTGDWLVRFEPRSLANVAAIVQPDPENERRFATVKLVSDIHLKLYRALLQPIVRAQVKAAAAASASANADLAQWMRRLTPAELPYYVFSESNPLMSSLASLAEWVKQKRKPVPDGNWLLALQENVSRSVVAALDGCRDFRDGAIEFSFKTIYGSPVTQALAGLKASNTPPRPHPGISPESTAHVKQRMAETRASISQGGLREAALRSLVYISMGRGADERAFNALRGMRAEYSELSPAMFKQAVREQFFALMLDQQAALDAVPAMLATETRPMGKVLEVIHRVASAADWMTDEQRRRLSVVETLFAEQL